MGHSFHLVNRECCALYVDICKNQLTSCIIDIMYHYLIGIHIVWFDMVGTINYTGRVPFVLSLVRIFVAIPNFN